MFLYFVTNWMQDIIYILIIKSVFFSFRKKIENTRILQVVLIDQYEC